MEKGNPTTISSNGDETTEPTEPSREQIRMEFYKTYDAMTGVRIAATLGGFFSLMVLLVVYKSKCKSRSISEENLEATVTAVVEEDDNSFLFMKSLSLYRETYPVSKTRFSSVGGGFNMYAPPLRYSMPARGRVSLPTSSPYIYPSPFAIGTLKSTPPKGLREDCNDFEESIRRGPKLLCVPSSRRSSRRLSSITCSSCDTSYLERRGSSMEMGRPIGPPFNSSDRLEEEPWDFYYPIDIQVIQPTPDVSLADTRVSQFKYDNREPTTLCVPRIAPLASISSCQVPSLEHDSHSIGSDSVFLDEELIDTEDEVDEFSTDSDADNLECNFPSKLPNNDPKFNKLCSRRMELSPINRVPPRRYSSPLSTEIIFSECHSESKGGKKLSSSTRSFISTLKSSLRTSSDSDTIHVNTSRGFEVKPNRSFRSISRTSMSASCDHLVKVLHEHTSQSDTTTKVVEHCSWSQETLF